MSKPTGFEKVVTWIELFFDLVFVAGAHQVAYLLVNSTLMESLAYIGLFVMILWLWLSHTLFSARFAHRGSLYHVNTVLVACGIFALIVQLHGVFGPYGQTFALTYAATKAILILFYLEAILRNPLRLLYVLPLMIGYIASTVIWVLSAFAENMYLFWILAFAIDFVTPLYSQTLLQRIRIHTVHLPERLGLLTVVMLGEMIIALALSSANITLNSFTIYTLLAGILSVTMIFWVYFRHVERNIMHTHDSAGNLYTYSHLPLYVGLVCIAGSFKLQLANQSGMWLLLCGLMIFLLSFRSIKYVQEHYIPSRQVILVIIYASLLLFYIWRSPNDIIQFILVNLSFVLYLYISEFILTMFKEGKTHNQKHFNTKHHNWEF